MKIKSDVLLKKGKHGYEAWQTNKLLAKVPGFDEDSKDRIMKYIPTYENVIEESLDKRIVSGYQQNEKSLKAVLSSRTFDDVELQILFDNIVGGQDEMFFEWYTDKYGELPWNDLNSIPRERIVEYVNENPDVLEDMEYEISISKDDYAAGNTLNKNVNDFLNSSKKIKSSLDHFEEYVSSDAFVDRGDDTYQIYIMDKLSEKGFDPEEIEFGWYDDPVKSAREEIEKNFNQDDFVKWAEKYISQDKYRLAWYKDWLRANGYPVEEDSILKKYSFDPARNTFPGPESY